MLLQGVRPEKQGLATQLQQAQAANHNITGQLSSMVKNLNTAKQASHVLAHCSCVELAGWLFEKSP